MVYPQLVSPKQTKKNPDGRQSFPPDLVYPLDTALECTLFR